MNWFELYCYIASYLFIKKPSLASFLMRACEKSCLSQKNRKFVNESNKGWVSIAQLSAHWSFKQILFTMNEDLFSVFTLFCDLVFYLINKSIALGTIIISHPHLLYFNPIKLQDVKTEPILWTVGTNRGRKPVTPKQNEYTFSSRPACNYHMTIPRPGEWGINDQGPGILCLCSCVHKGSFEH